MTVLSISGLGKSHGATEILRGVELNIARGDKLGCVGKNGAGKTTLLRLIEGSVSARDAHNSELGQPDHGTIQLEREAFQPGHAASLHEHRVALTEIAQGASRRR